CQQYDTYPYSF
nr:immunoglobulin light chain junction region [Macaca mulatta]